jgi:vacuolar-type H+-ATPase subunit H
VIAIDILGFVDRLEALASAGWRVPLTARIAIDESGFFEILDEMRVAIPQEIKQAQDLLQQKEQLLAEATTAAERIEEEARQRAARLVDEHELMAAARAEADAMKAQVQREAEMVRAGANDYALGMLSDLESRLSSLLRTTANGLATLKRRQAQADSGEPKAGSGTRPSV